MSIDALPNAVFEATTGPTATGLVGTIGVEIVSGDTEITPRTTDGIIESPPGSGLYIATMTAPNWFGSYTIRWDNGADPPLYAIEGLTVSTGEIEFVPTVAEIGVILRARTRQDVTGDELGTFDNTTRPTGLQVQQHIDAAAAFVQLRLGPNIPEGMMASAREAVTYRAGYMIELSLADDRSDNPDSAYQRLKGQYDETMTALQDSLLDVRAATTTRVASVSVVSPTLAHLSDEARAAAQGPYV